jgi:DNA-binding response OmpR family regulator
MSAVTRTLHTEAGDVVLSPAEHDVYSILARDRFKVMARGELACRAGFGTGPGALRHLDSVAASLRARIKAETGLQLVCNVWGVGYRLENQHWSGA